jgi:zinc transporter 9
VLVAVSVNAVITVAKFFGYVMTGSPALLAEGIHSTADVGNQFLLYIGIKSSQKDADPDHPYGFGPARYLWNLKSAMGIFFLGAGATLWHGGHTLYEHLAHGAEAHGGPDESSMWGIGILTLAFVLEGFSLLVAIKGIAKDKGDQSWCEYIREGDDPTSVGVLLEDGAAVLGVVIALVGVTISHVTHSPVADSIASILIGLLLAWLAIFLAKANGRLLIGASVSTRQKQRIQEVLEADEMVEKVQDLKTSIIGQGRMRVKCEVDLYEKLIAKRMKDSLKQDADRIRNGEDPLKVIVDVVGRSVRITGDEIERLERKIKDVAPTAVHIDLELI